MPGLRNFTFQTAVRGRALLALLVRKFWLAAAEWYGTGPNDQK